MDDDVKTLLAILALIYGSSNGIGLLKDRLKPVEANIKTLEPKIGNEQFVVTAKPDAKKLLKSLWSGFVVAYVLMVLIVPTFLLLVVLRGPMAVLTSIGLANPSVQPTTSTKPSTFYWILFGLSLIATAHYLSEYFKGWWVLVKYLRGKPPAAKTEP